MPGLLGSAFGVAIRQGSGVFCLVRRGMAAGLRDTPWPVIDRGPAMGQFACYARCAWYAPSAEMLAALPHEVLAGRDRLRRNCMVVTTCTLLCSGCHNH